MTTPLPLAAGFVVPGLALAGLAAAAIPVVIHLLLRRRRRPIEWAAMELLRQALERRRRRLRLERLLLLAIRMAALALLGAALARPYLGEAGASAGSRRIWIVLDDGVATRVEDADGDAAFERLRRETASWVERRPVGDEIGVVLASRPPRVLLEPTADRRRVAERIEAQSPSLAATDLRGGLALVSERLAATPSVEPLVLVASEFRQGSLEGGSGTVSGLSTLNAVEGLQRLALPPTSTSIDNVQIAAIAPGRPPVGGGLAPIGVELARQGSLEAATTRISLSGPRLATAVQRDVSWRAGDRTVSAELLVPVPQPAPGQDPDLLVEVSIPPDGQAADDRRFVLLDARPRLRVGIAADDRDLRSWFARALSPSPETPIELVAIEPALLDNSSLRTLEALVVARPDLLPASSWPALEGMIQRGGVVIVTPPAAGGGIAWLDRLAEIVPGASWTLGAGAIEVPEGPGRRINPENSHPAWLGMIAAEFEELAEPVSILRRLEIGPEVPDSEIVLRGLDGAPLVVAATVPSGGSIALFAMALDLDWSDLPVRPLMVPLVQEILREGVVRSRIRTVGTVGDFASAGVVDATAVETPAGGRIAVREGRLERPIEEIGRHRILDASGGLKGGLVANIDAAAASTEPSDRAAVAAALEDGGFGGGPDGGADIESSVGAWRFTDDRDTDASASVGETGDGALSAWMLAGVIGLLIVEAILARRFTHASSNGAAVAAAPAFLAAFGVGEGGARASEKAS